VFEGFSTTRIATGSDNGSDNGGATINAVHGGSGPPVLLLHGFPQTHAMWHRVAPELARGHTVVAPDLRGYGDSSRPPEGDDHGGYSFRSMAADQVAVMRSLGHERFAVVGHDRGARVAHRMTLDHPEVVTRLAVLDIVPTLHVYEHVDKALATAYYHWFFFIQPAPIPERLIDGDPIGYLHALLGAWGSGLSVFAPEALAEYERCFADAATRHAMLEDYRAGASIDLEHDRADVDRKVEVPTLVVWGAQGVVGRRPESPLDVWRERATDVRGTAVDAGHFLIEERPAEMLDLLEGFLGGALQ
jgi:haloacetate dehalogenase